MSTLVDVVTHGVDAHVNVVSIVAALLTRVNAVEICHLLIDNKRIHHSQMLRYIILGKFICLRQRAVEHLPHRHPCLYIQCRGTRVEQKSNAVLVYLERVDIGLRCTKLAVELHETMQIKKKKDNEEKDDDDVVMVTVR